MEHVIVNFIICHVCAQVYVSAVASLTRYGGYKYVHLFPVSGWVSSRVLQYWVFFLFRYKLLLVAVLLIIIIIIRLLLRCWVGLRLRCWDDYKNGGGRVYVIIQSWGVCNTTNSRRFSGDGVKVKYFGIHSGHRT